MFSEITLWFLLKMQKLYKIGTVSYWISLMNSLGIVWADWIPSIAKAWLKLSTVVGEGKV
jgi:hypothetical protein